MLTSSHLDWLSITFEASTVLHATLPRLAAQFPWKQQAGAAHGYRSRYTNELGVTVLADGSLQQGTHVVMGGQALSNIRDLGVSDRELCQHVLERGGKVARIDLAINLHGAELTVDDLATALKEKRLKTPARGGKHIKGIDKPDNGLYIGGRQSERCFRAYDKNAEQHIVDAEAWLRLELECKKARARAVTAAVAQHDNTRTVINKAIGDYVSFPENGEYSAALADNDAIIPQVPRKLTETYRWLLEQVAPAMARYQSEHPDEDIETAFLTVYRLHLERLNK
jgi:DNA relaxase NicK